MERTRSSSSSYDQDERRSGAHKHLSYYKTEEGRRSRQHHNYHHSARKRECSPPSLGADRTDSSSPLVCRKKCKGALTLPSSTCVEPSPLGGRKLVKFRREWVEFVEPPKALPTALLTTSARAAAQPASACSPGEEGERLKTDVAPQDEDDHVDVVVRTAQPEPETQVGRGGITNVQEERQQDPEEQERKRTENSHHQTTTAMASSNTSPVSPAMASASVLASTVASALLAQKQLHSQLCRIYVGSLDYSLTEHDIRSVFQAFGTIAVVDMPKETGLLRSKGFCFVEFTTKEAAEMALTTMQGFQLKGRRIKIGRPTLTSAAAAAVAAGNSVTSALLLEAMKASGDQTTATVTTTEQPVAQTPQITTPLEAGALAAASLLKAEELQAASATTTLASPAPSFSSVGCSEASSSQHTPIVASLNHVTSSSTSPPPSSAPPIFGNLSVPPDVLAALLKSSSCNITNDALAAALSTPRNAMPSLHSETLSTATKPNGTSNESAYITASGSAGKPRPAASPAQGEVVSSTEYAVDGTTGTQNTAESLLWQTRIYVGSIPQSFTSQDIQEIFSVVGSIQSCDLVHGDSDTSCHRGYGFIEFATAQEASLAISTMNGFEIGGKKLKVNRATVRRMSTSL